MEESPPFIRNLYGRNPNGSTPIPISIYCGKPRKTFGIETNSNSNLELWISIKHFTTIDYRRKNTHYSHWLSFAGHHQSCQENGARRLSCYRLCAQLSTTICHVGWKCWGSTPSWTSSWQWRRCTLSLQSRPWGIGYPEFSKVSLTPRCWPHAAPFSIRQWHLHPLTSPLRIWT